MTFTNRKTAREALTAGLKTAVTAAANVLDHIPNKMAKSGSPVVTVSSGPWFPQFQGSAHSNTMDLFVTVWVKRVNKEQDKDFTATAEDELDNTSKQVVEYLETWNNDFPSQPSVPDYLMLDGWQWRTETHFSHIDHYEGE